MVKEYKRLPNKSNSLVENPVSATIAKDFINFPGGCTPDENYIILTGRKTSVITSDGNEPLSENIPQRVIFNDIANRFYRDKTGLPTNEGDTIRVIIIKKNLSGEGIQPKSFSFVNETYNFNDDGLGGVYGGPIEDNVKIGDIFYKESTVVITHQSYQLFLPIPLTVYPVRKDIYENSTTITLSNTPVVTPTTDVSISGNVITFSSLPLGESTFSYHVLDSNGICSNESTITIIRHEVCDFSVNITDIVQTYPATCFVKLQKKNNILCEDLSTLPDFVIKNQSYIKLSDNRINHTFAFECTSSVSWLISTNFGITYQTLSSGNTLILTSETYGYYFFIKALKSDGSFVEKIVDLHPLEPGYRLEDLNRYVQPTLNCIGNQYVLDTNNIPITTSSWAFTGNLNATILSKDIISLVGYVGRITATVNTPSGQCSDSICLNGRLNNSPISHKIDVYGLENNKYIVVNRFNSYIKEHAAITFGNYIDVISNFGTSTYLLLANKVSTSQSVSFLLKDFCDNNYQKSVDIVYLEKVITTSTTLPISTTSTTRKLPDIDMVDLELSIQSSNYYPSPGEKIELIVTVKNTANIDATNVDVAVYLPTGLLFHSVNYPTNIHVFNGKVSAEIGNVKSGETGILRFYVTPNSSVTTVLEVGAEVTDCDQVDIDSIPGDGIIPGMDDSDIIKLIVSTPSPTTTLAPCSPIIRPLPYTYVSYDGDLGTIHVSAVNPRTDSEEGLEYSYKGDVDLYYIDSPISPPLTNGLYTVFIRDKNNIDCKTSIQIRVISSIENELLWIIKGTVCIKEGELSIPPTTNPYSTTFNPSNENESRDRFGIIPLGTVNGINRIFQVPEDFIESTLRVYWNGTRLYNGLDYTINGQYIQMVIPLESDAWIILDYKIPS